MFRYFLCTTFILFTQHCFICRPSEYTVSEDAGIDPMTIVTLALTARRFRRSNHSARSLFKRRLSMSTKIFMCMMSVCLKMFSTHSASG